MSRTINLEPVSRIEGQARISIRLDENQQVDRTRLHVMSLRGFEKFLEGRPAEEAPRIVSRICGICPWLHHAAAVKAVDGCFKATVPDTARRLREMLLTLAHIPDKILHFFFLAAPDYLEGDHSGRPGPALAALDPELTRRVAAARTTARLITELYAGKDIHPVIMLPGGLAKPLDRTTRLAMLAGAEELLSFARWAMAWAKEDLLLRMAEDPGTMFGPETGFLSLAQPEDGAMNFYEGHLRLMRPDGTFSQFRPEEYTDHLAEKVVPWSYSKLPYAKAWGQGLELDPDNPLGVYRVNTLARINAVDVIPTPLAQAELQLFRSRFGRPAQAAGLYHWARLIELLFAAERVVELLSDPGLSQGPFRAEAQPGPGRGIGCVEAPRGTLIHDYTTDENGLITKANIIVGTTHNMAAMNLAVAGAARQAFGRYGLAPQSLAAVERSLRAYDP